MSIAINIMLYLAAVTTVFLVDAVTKIPHASYAKKRDEHRTTAQSAGIIIGLLLSGALSLSAIKWGVFS